MAGNMDPVTAKVLRWAEFVFLCSSTIFNLTQLIAITPYLAFLYVSFLAAVIMGVVKLGSPQGPTFFSSPLAVFNACFYLTLMLNRTVNGLSSSGLPVISHASPRFPSVASDLGASLIPNIVDLLAVNAQDVCPGYQASNITTTRDGLTATLILAGESCNIYGTDVESLDLIVEYQALDRLAINIHPTYLGAANSSLYILPEDLVPKPRSEDAQQDRSDYDLEFRWSNEPTFSFSVVRSSTGEAIFSTHGTKIVYEDQFLEFTTSMPENYNLYGLGEVIHGLRLGNDLTRTLYAADAGDPIDGNIYGSHPFYLETRYYSVDEHTGKLTRMSSAEIDSEKTYTSHSSGLYNRNAHPQEILLRRDHVTWRALGGSIDLHFYAGPTPAMVTSQYQKSSAGLPAMQQYFTLGFHQCRWGYHDWHDLQAVVDAHAEVEIPLETIWSDIDYMNQYRDFDNDADRFDYAEGAKFLERLVANGQHYVPIVDSAIHVPDPANEADVYPPFHAGNKTGSFMLNPDGSLYIGSVWPGYTVFPDWLPGSGANAWWIDQMRTWHGKVNFSGIWIDMNEPSSFCVGSCGSSMILGHPVSLQQRDQQILGGDEAASEIISINVSSAASGSTSASPPLDASASAISGSAFLRTKPTPGRRNVNHPPYVINNIHGDLAVHTVSPNATHHDGTMEYDVHNLFGHQILNATYHALLAISPNDRPFIIGRGTFVGSGTVAGHWGGDNASKWAYMFFSIPQALSFSLFGIPMFGADICGFGGDTEEELCNRWMQLGAFFPFYRNHNDVSSRSQEAYVWDSVAEAARTAMNIRFQLLPYFYTLFHLAHTTGSTVMRALSWEFPHDPSLAAADRQFFLGPAILVTPVLVQGAASVDGVFPGAGITDVYYDWYTQHALAVSAGQNVTLEAPLGHIPVHIRGGHVLATQPMAMTTRAARALPWSVLVARGVDGRASGVLYLDDGHSLKPASQLLVELTALPNQLSSSRRGDYDDRNPLANVTIMGVVDEVSDVTFNGIALRHGVEYDASHQLLTIVGLERYTNDGAWTSDWVLTW